MLKLIDVGVSIAEITMANEQAIILHEAAVKALQAAQIGGKLPSVTALQSEYEKFQSQKEALYADYGKLKNRSRNTTLSSGTLTAFCGMETYVEIGSKVLIT